MKNRKTIVIAAGFALLSVAALGWVACNGIPNDDKGTGADLVLNVVTPRPAAAEAAKDAGPLAVKKLDLTAPAEPAIGPSASAPMDAYVLRVSLTNPEETFIVYGWVEGVPVRLQVSPGSGRLLNVEAYYVTSSSPGYFPAYLYQTITPEAQRILDLTGASKTVDIELGPQTNLGDVSGGVIFDYPFSAGAMPAPTVDAPLPLPGSSPFCPYPSYNHTNVTDPAFGLTFGPIETPLWPTGSPGSLNLYGLPENRPYNLSTYNSLSGIHAENYGVSVLNGASPTAVDLHFTGYHDPAIRFSPASMPMMNPFDTSHFLVYGSGGWGISSIMVPSSSCNNVYYSSVGPGVWQVDFEAPNAPDCYIYVEAYDCGVSSWGPNMAYHSIVIPINYSGGWGWP